jgi:hypothetical protein
MAIRIPRPRVCRMLPNDARQMRNTIGGMRILETPQPSHDFIGTADATRLVRIKPCCFESAAPWYCPDLIQRQEDLARENQRYLILDFGDWEDHNSYQKAFDRPAKT